MQEQHAAATPKVLLLQASACLVCSKGTTSILAVTGQSEFREITWQGQSGQLRQITCQQPDCCSGLHCRWMSHRRLPSCSQCTWRAVLPGNHSHVIQAPSKFPMSSGCINMLQPVASPELDVMSSQKRSPEFDRGHQQGVPGSQPSTAAHTEASPRLQHSWSPQACP